MSRFFVYPLCISIFLFPGAYWAEGAPLPVCGKNLVEETFETIACLSYDSDSEGNEFSYMDPDELETAADPSTPIYNAYLWYQNNKNGLPCPSNCREVTVDSIAPAVSGYMTYAWKKNCLVFTWILGITYTCYKKLIVEAVDSPPPVNWDELLRN